MISNKDYMGQNYSRKDSMFFTFQGRINRLSFFLRIIGLIAIAFIATFFIAIFAGLLAAIGSLGMLLGILIMIVFIGGIWIASLTLYVRRLHDINLSGMWVLGYVILSLLIGALEFATYDPAIQIISLVFNLLVIISALLLLFWPGTKRPNKYGKDPLNRDSEYLDEVFGDGKPKRDPATEYTPAYLRQGLADKSQSIKDSKTW